MVQSILMSASRDYKTSSLTMIINSLIFASFLPIYFFEIFTENIPISVDLAIFPLVLPRKYPSENLIIQEN